MFLLKKMVWSILGALGLLLMMELYIRGSGMVMPSITDYNDVEGRVRRSNQSFIMFGEGFTINKFNYGRYLGPYYDLQKTQNTIRIALLGDSFVEGFQVFDRHHFRRTIEDIIAEATDRPTEVLNFGRSGFDLEDIVANHYLKTQNYNPDYTLFFLKNDDYVSKVTDPLVPNIVFANDSVYTRIFASDEVKNNFIRRKDIPFYSTYLNMIGNCIKQHKGGITKSKLLDKFYRPKISLPQSGENIDEVLLDDPQLQRIRSLLEFSNAIGNLILVKSDTIELSPNILDIINREGIIMLSLENTLKSMTSEGTDPYYWKVTNRSGHWNHSAHEKIGEYIAIEICNMINQK